MSAQRPPSATNNVGAAADRVMHLWSMIRLDSDADLSEQRTTVLQKLAEQPDLAEDQLVVVGLKYLHQHIGLRKEMRRSKSAQTHRK